MAQDIAVETVSHAIQLSVAPVFLLTAVGAMLGVMTSRLGRIIDRARLAESRLTAESADTAAALQSELVLLARRARLIQRAITLYAVTALCICGVVGALFAAAFLRVDASIPVAVLFVAAMGAFIVALICFLREIFIATATLRFGPP